MNIITVTKDNLEKEHICCAISNNDDCQVKSKKAWLRARFDEGLVFKKGDVRGKCFIEYIPAEAAWAPIAADGYTYIDCLWVSGQFKGHGYSNLLFDECVKDSRAAGRHGIVALSSKKKLPFIADPKYLEYKGFSVADSAEPSYLLMYLPFDKNAPVPQFRECAKNPKVTTGGYALYYTEQCPYTAKYVPILAETAKARGVKFKATRFENAAEAQNAPIPFTTFGLFYNGKFVTHEILSDKKFAGIIDANM